MSDTPYNHPAIDAILDAIEWWETADLDSDAPIHGAVGFINRLAERGFSIEGEDIELDPYLKHKRFGISFLPDHTQKYDALDHEAALPFLLMLPKALVL